METVINSNKNQLSGRESSLDNTSETVSNSKLPALNNFQKELTVLINKYSLENNSNTPDFILAEYLIACLQNYELAIMAREIWFNNEIDFTAVDKG